MFLKPYLPERSWVTQVAWEGSYADLPMSAVRRGHTWGVYFRGRPITRKAKLVEALHAAKCAVDWERWQSELTPRSRALHDAARQVIEQKLTRDPKLAILDDWGLVGFSMLAGEWLSASTLEVERWWDNRDHEQRNDFARDVRECWLGPTEQMDAWERIGFQRAPMRVAEWNRLYPIGTRVRYYPVAGQGDYQAASTREKAWVELEGTPVTMIGGLAGAVSLDHLEPIDKHDTAPEGRAVKKARQARRKKPRKRAPQEPEPIESPFGTCPRCPGVCIRMDVNTGCCTVCGGPLQQLNPSGGYLETPDFAFQLFIPRHEKEWKGLPKRLLTQRVAASGKSADSRHNKPAGAFWTSTFGLDDDGQPASDWDQWMRNNMHESHLSSGVVLRVLPTANVKHLTTKEEAEAFLDEYGVPGTVSQVMGEKPRREPDWSGGGPWWGLFQMVPDWPWVYREFDALHLEGGALRHPAFYGWDAESTAWFNTDHLEEVEQVQMPKAEDPYEDNPPRRRKRKRKANGKLTTQERRRLFRSLMRRA